MYKLVKQPGRMKLALFAGIDSKSEGLFRARAEGIPSSQEGIGAILEDPDIKLVFDATSAKAHRLHAPMLRQAGRVAIDLTPAAVGPYVVPSVDGGQYLDELNVNLITCGGHACVALGDALRAVTPVDFAVVSSHGCSRV